MGVFTLKIEKLSENKIRIILNLEDLKKKNIDFHSFMSDPIESQSLFLDMLHTAEQEIGFVTKDYKISIEAFAMSDGNFVLTVTRDLEDLSKIDRKKVHIKRKSFDFTKTTAIYTFYSFDDLCSFCEFIRNNSNYSGVSNIHNTSLYKYNGSYYLCFHNIVRWHKKFEGLLFNSYRVFNFCRFF